MTTMPPTGFLVPADPIISRAVAVLLAALATSAAAATESAPQPTGQADANPSAAPATAVPTGAAEPAAEPASLMRLLAQKGLHDLKDESWNAYAQFTYISSWKPGFPAAYTNLNGSINSLLPEAEHSSPAPP